MKNEDINMKLKMDVNQDVRLLNSYLKTIKRDIIKIEKLFFKGAKVWK